MCVCVCVRACVCACVRACVCDVVMSSYGVDLSLVGTFEEYEVPYMAKLCSPHPTRHDLITLVCHQHYRPEVSHRLYSHSLVGLVH